MPGGGWISGPCNGGAEDLPAVADGGSNLGATPERNVVPERDDEQVGSASIPTGGPEDADELGQQAEFPQVNPWAGGIEQGATHFALRVRPNQRKYRGQSRGTARED